MCRPNVIVYLDLSPESSMARIKQRARNVGDGIPLEYLIELRNEYEAFIDDISRTVPVIRVEWEQYRAVEEIAQEVIEREYFNQSFLRRAGSDQAPRRRWYDQDSAQDRATRPRRSLTIATERMCREIQACCARQWASNPCFTRHYGGFIRSTFLELLVLMLTQPKKVVEVGTLAGFSALAMARALPSEGRIWTIENDQSMPRSHGQISKPAMPIETWSWVTPNQRCLKLKFTAHSTWFFSMRTKSATISTNLGRRGISGPVVCCSPITRIILAISSTKTKMQRQCEGCMNKQLQPLTRCVYPHRMGLVLGIKRWPNAQPISPFDNGVGRRCRLHLRHYGHAGTATRQKYALGSDAAQARVSRQGLQKSQSPQRRSVR